MPMQRQKQIYETVINRTKIFQYHENITPFERKKICKFWENFINPKLPNTKKSIFIIHYLRKKRMCGKKLNYHSKSILVHLMETTLTKSKHTWYMTLVFTKSPPHSVWYQKIRSNDFWFHVGVLFWNEFPSNFWISIKQKAVKLYTV